METAQVEEELTIISDQKETANLGEGHGDRLSQLLVLQGTPSQLLHEGHRARRDARFFQRTFNTGVRSFEAWDHVLVFDGSSRSPLENSVSDSRSLGRAIALAAPGV